MLMTDKYYKENNLSKPGLIKRVETLAFVLLLISATIIFLFKEYRDAAKSHEYLYFHTDDNLRRI